MNFRRQTSTQLMQAARLPLWVGLIPGIFVLVGVGVIILFGQISQLSCSRPLESCQHQISGLLGTEVKRIPINELQGAQVQTSRSSDGDTTYRVVVLTRNGEVPLTQYYSSGYDEKQEVVSQIETFIGNSEQVSLAVQEDGRWFAYSFGGLFATVGLLTIWFIFGAPGSQQLERLMWRRVK